MPLLGVYACIAYHSVKNNLHVKIIEHYGLHMFQWLHTQARGCHCDVYTMIPYSNMHRAFKIVLVIACQASGHFKVD